MNARSSIVPRGINPWRICGSMNGFGDISLIYIMQPTEFNVDSEGLKDKGGSREGVVRRGEAKVFFRVLHGRHGRTAASSVSVWSHAAVKGHAGV